MMEKPGQGTNFSKLPPQKPRDSSWKSATTSFQTSKVTPNKPSNAPQMSKHVPQIISDFERKTSDNCVGYDNFVAKWNEDAFDVVLQYLEDEECFIHFKAHLKTRGGDWSNNGRFQPSTNDILMLARYHCRIEDVKNRLRSCLEASIKALERGTAAADSTEGSV